VRSADAAKALLSKSLSDRSHPQPRVINTDKARCYPLAISEAKDKGILRRRCRHRPVAYLNNILEQDHQAIRTTRPLRSGFVPSNISVISIAHGELSRVTRRSTRFGKGKYDG
jgi:transposase-like protein